MARGGARPGAGRKKGQVSKMTAELREEAKATGKLPHEILLSVARGERKIVRRLEVEYYKHGPKKGQVKNREWVEEDYYPNHEEQVDAAKAAAPYYAPRLATQTNKSGDRHIPVLIDKQDKDA